MKFTASSNPVSTFLASSSDAEQSAYTSLPEYVPNRDIDIPSEFDGRKAWGKLLTDVQNQGVCGACWAIASTSALADLFNIHSAGIINVRLSAAKLILCDISSQPSYDPSQGGAVEDLWGGLVKQILSNACYGSSLTSAFTYLYIYGTVKDECVPFVKKEGYRTYDLTEATNLLNAPVCMDMTGEIGDVCVNSIYDPKTGLQTGSAQDFYRTWSVFAIVGEINMIHQVYTYGPVATGFMVYNDFYAYDAKKEIYQWDRKSKEIGGHAVVVVGFGENENGVKYWLVRNSWGTEWGDNGYFKILRGVNECQIEANAVGCIPDFWYPYNLQTLGWLETHMKTTTSDQQLYLERLYKMRAAATTDWGTTGGGINPMNGYIWRAMSSMPWNDYLPPVLYTDVPDWTKWICGRDFKDGVLAKYIPRSEKQKREAQHSIDHPRGAVVPSSKEKYANHADVSPYAGLYAVLTACLCLVMLCLLIMIIWRRVKRR